MATKMDSMDIYIQARERLDKEFKNWDHPPGFDYLPVWEHYEKAFNALVMELMKTREQDILKIRPSGSTIVKFLRTHVDQRTMFRMKNGDAECELERNHIGKSFNGEVHELDRKDPNTRLGTYLEYIEKEHKKWRTQREKRTLTQELIDLVTVDSALEHIEKDMVKLVLSYPEASLDVMERKVHLLEILHKKWIICSEEVPNQLKSLEYYDAFRANWQCHLKVVIPIPPKRELILLKQLIAKPELEVVRSVEEFWKHGGEYLFTKNTHGKNTPWQFVAKF